MVHLVPDVFFELAVTHRPEFFGAVDSEFLRRTDHLERDRDRNLADLSGERGSSRQLSGAKDRRNAKERTLSTSGYRRLRSHSSELRESARP